MHTYASKYVHIYVYIYVYLQTFIHIHMYIHLFSIARLAEVMANESNLENAMLGARLDATSRTELRCLCVYVII
jgi:hypothetical protein